MRVKELQKSGYKEPEVSMIRLAVKCRILSLSQERDIDDGTEGEEDGD